MKKGPDEEASSVVRASVPSWKSSALVVPGEQKSWLRFVQLNVSQMASQKLRPNLRG